MNHSSPARQAGLTLPSASRSGEAPGHAGPARQAGPTCPFVRSPPASEHSTGADAAPHATLASFVDASQLVDLPTLQSPLGTL